MILFTKSLYIIKNWDFLLFIRLVIIFFSHVGFIRLKPWFVNGWRMVISLTLLLITVIWWRHMIKFWDKIIRVILCDVIINSDFRGWRWMLHRTFLMSQSQMLLMMLPHWLVLNLAYWLISAFYGNLHWLGHSLCWVMMTITTWICGTIHTEVTIGLQCRSRFHCWGRSRRQLLEFQRTL